ncbi:MAG: transcription termination/antitermination protein NusA, partial [Actinomycetota bacterium]|nr:transcription termination/antitermination protein NusA [Actinomycetota bacterium]
ELRGEKVDIVPFVDSPSELVMKALAPAKVREVRIHEDTGIAEVIVPDFQLSLAIGKEGQNARLAARLTGWRVDIKSETQLAEEESGEFFAEGEWVEGPDGELMWQPEGGGDAISAADAGYAGATAADLAAAAAAAAEAAAAATPAPETPVPATPVPAAEASATPASEAGDTSSDGNDGAAGADAAAESGDSSKGEADASATIDPDTDQ